MKIVRFNPPFTGFHIVSKIMVAIFGKLTHSKASAIAIFPFVFYSNKYVRLHMITRSKQEIYIQQQMECGMAGLLIYVILGLTFESWLFSLPAIFLWIIIYILNYIVNIFKHSYGLPRALIAFNREANRFSNILHYITLRRPFNWIKYLRF